MNNLPYFNFKNVKAAFVDWKLFNKGERKAPDLQDRVPPSTILGRIRQDKLQFKHLKMMVDTGKISDIPAGTSYEQLQNICLDITKESDEPLSWESVYKAVAWNHLLGERNITLRTEKLNAGSLAGHRELQESAGSTLENWIYENTKDIFSENITLHKYQKYVLDRLKGSNFSFIGLDALKQAFEVKGGTEPKPEEPRKTISADVLREMSKTTHPAFSALSLTNRNGATPTFTKVSKETSKSPGTGTLKYSTPAP